MRRQLLIVTLCAYSLLSAQSAHQFTLGDVQLRVNSNGILAVDLSNLNPSSSYKQEAKHFLNQAGLWISALDPSNNLYINAQLVLDTAKFDVGYGPLDTFTGKQAEGDWNKVWQVDAETISEHKQNYANTGYTVPANIENWPAISGTDLIRFLAPFADVNGNEIYDPEYGDYPYIQGDRAIYCIYNDNSGEHKVSKGAPLGIEVHLMLYQKNEFPQIFFCEYYIINRSDRQYKDIKIGFMLGGQNGNPADNFAATQSTQNTVYIYNGDDIDEGVFNNQLPFVFCKWLSHPLESSIAFEKSSDLKRGLAQSAAEFDSYLHAKWRDQSRLNFGDSGVGNGNPSSFIYNYDSNWNEDAGIRLAGERNMLSVIGINALGLRSYVRCELALGYGFYGNTENVHEIVKSESQKLQALAGLEAVVPLALKQFPNPSREYFVIETEEVGEYEIKITDIQGHTLYNNNIFINHRWLCNEKLLPGVYILELNRNGRMFKKLINVQP